MFEIRKFATISTICFLIILVGWGHFSQPGKVPILLVFLTIRTHLRRIFQLMLNTTTSHCVGFYIGQNISTRTGMLHHIGEYLCMDKNAEYLTEGDRQIDYNGRLFYPVCGSLPCPPYKSSQLISCVVCSK